MSCADEVTLPLLRRIASDLEEAYQELHGTGDDSACITLSGCLLKVNQVIHQVEASNA